MSRNMDQPSLVDTEQGSSEKLARTLIHSDYPEVTDTEDMGINAPAVPVNSPVVTPFSQDMFSTLPAFSRTEDLTVDEKDSDITPKASDFQLRTSTPSRPRFMTRRSLLNEPISFLSTTSSARSSATFEEDVMPESNGTHVGVSSRLIQYNPSNIVIPGRDRLIDHRPKAARILGANIHALANEQGGIPISVLSSPIYRQPLVASIVPELHSPAITERDQTSAMSSKINNVAPPLPLRSHPPMSNALQELITRPPKLSKKPKFIPTPLDTSGTRGCCSRESVISTPYPSSDFGYLQPLTSIANTDGERDNGFLGSEHQLFVIRIPILIRSVNNYISAVGGIGIPNNINEKKVKQSKDDRELVNDISKEYRRLRGWHSFLSARCLVGVRIITKRLTYETPASEIENECIWSKNRGSRPVPFSENYQTRLHIALPHTSSRDAKITTLIHDLEESLTLLLKRPSLEAKDNICSTDLRHLVSELTHLEKSGCHRSTLAIELVRGWNRFKIGIAIIGVLTLSMFSTVLWVLLGINQGINTDDREFIPAVRIDEWTSSTDDRD